MMQLDSAHLASDFLTIKVQMTDCRDSDAQVRSRGTVAQQTCEPVVAILVPPAAVSCEVVALVVLEIGLLEAVMVIG